MKRKRIIAVMALFAVICSGALAESGVYEGSVIATYQQNILAPASGTLKSVSLTKGALITEGCTVAEYATDKVFAKGDGTVSAIWAELNEEMSGDVLEIEPYEKYTVYVTTDGAYSTEENLMVHAGEEVYIKCTSDGSHRGKGYVTGVSGTEYTVRTTAGEFYVGETVYIFRDADFSKKQRIGKGTLIFSDNDISVAEGRISAIYVKEGDYAEKGQLLYEVIKAENTVITAISGGLVSSVSVQAGASVAEGDVLATIYPQDSLEAEFSVPTDEAAKLEIGDYVEAVFADDSETKYPGAITFISDISDDEYVTVRASVERVDMRASMSVSVFIGKD